MLRIALAKGYLFKEALALLAQIGYTFDESVNWDRRLSAVDTQNKIQVFQVRPWDVSEYIEHGAADLGVVGQDVLLEKQDDVVRLLDLKFGFCRLVLAGPQDPETFKLQHNLTVATKYPNATELFFKERGLKVNLVKLYGAVELAATTGISDVISDLTATGTTLKENNLNILQEIFSSTALLVANRTSMKAHYTPICDLVQALSKLI